MTGFSIKSKAPCFIVATAISMFSSPDIITTGTPAGVGMGMSPPDYLKDGDEMILKVDKLGTQDLKVIKEK